MAIEISGGTKIVGVFGYPVKHSSSPAMHNAAFRACNLNYVYLAFEVKPESLGQALRGLPALGIRGVNLTIPHKENALKFMDKLSSEAAAMGAVNTVVIDHSVLTGHDTDTEGFLKSLSEESGFEPQGQKAMVLGAGGASRAVLFGLARAKVSEIVIANRTIARAEKLASETCGKFPEVKTKTIPLSTNSITEEMASCSLLVNATPLGMNGENPIRNADCFHKNLTVYDLIYIPQSTPLLKEAKKAGARTIGGLNMLVYQGAISFELWTGIKPPISIMKDAAEEAVRKKCN